MRRSVITITSVLLIGPSMVLQGCADRDEDMASTEVEVGESGPAELTVGQILVIELPSNPSTGFRWEITSAPDPTILEADQVASYEPDRTDVAGSGGLETWRFEAVAEGTTTIELVYRRSWETGVPPADTVAVDVRVRTP